VRDPTKAVGAREDDRNAQTNPNFMPCRMSGAKKKSFIAMHAVSVLKVGGIFVH
jgi:hypothetical protein